MVKQSYEEPMRITCCFCAGEFKPSACLVHDEIRMYHFDIKEDKDTYRTMRIDACRDCQDEIYAVLEEHRCVQQKYEDRVNKRR